MSLDRWLQRPYVEARISDAEHRHEMRVLPPLERKAMDPDAEDIILIDGANATLVVLGTARECVQCRRASSTFVNRDGSTLCLACDGCPELPY